jgi:hypothetical protein
VKKIAVHGGADSLRPEAAGTRGAGRGDLSQDGHRPGHVLQLEETVFGFGAVRAKEAAPARGGEHAAQEAGGGPEPG